MRLAALLLLTACTRYTAEDCFTGSVDVLVGPQPAYTEGFADGADDYWGGSPYSLDTDATYAELAAPPLLRACYVIGYEHGFDTASIHERGQPR